MSELQKNPGGGNSNSIDAFLGELVQSIKAKETVVFCGAGISRHSGLPIVNELVPHILAKLGVTTEETQTIMNSNLPFEAFMDILRENSDVSRIFDIFDLGEPNTNHILLAKLAKAGLVTTICTTNFDCLIEKTFDREGLARGKDYQVYYKEADLQRIQWNAHPIHLIKIHGSVEDRENMAITLGQVASQVLSSQRYGVIKHIFSGGPHQQVLILGYSCSDVFDISPQIEAIRENHKKVLLVDHYKNELAVKDLAERQEKNPFRHFGESRWIVYNTDNVVKAIWNSCIAEKIPSQPVIDKTAWQKYVEAWSSERKKINKYNIAGQIFYRVSEFEKSLRYLEQALDIARQTGDRALEGRELNNISQIFRSRGDFETALEYLERSLKIHKEIGDKAREGRTLNNISQIFQTRGDHAKALEYLERSLKISQEIGDKELEGTTLNNISQTFQARGGHAKALEYLERSLKISQEIGDKAGEGTTLHNVSLIFKARGDYETALKYLERGLKISEEIGDKAGKGKTLNNISQIFQARGENAKALEYLERSLKISQEIGDKELEGTTVNNISLIYFASEDYETALEYFERSLKIHQEIGDKEGEGRTLNNISQIFRVRGDFETALEYLERSLKIYQEVKNKSGEAYTLFNLAMAYMDEKINQPERAIAYMQEVVRINALLKDAQLTAALKKLGIG